MNPTLEILLGILASQQNGHNRVDLPSAAHHRILSSLYEMNTAGETPNRSLSARTCRTLICRLPRRISETTP